MNLLLCSTGSAGTVEGVGHLPQEIVAEDLFIPKLEAIQQRIVSYCGREKDVSHNRVCKFFQDALVKYGEDDWDVSISPARDQTYVDTNAHKLVLPQKSFSVRKIRQLLAEEIETHVYRAVAGQHSSLALLGSGLAHHIATDEGLAHHYVQHVNQEVYGDMRKRREWNAHYRLAAGLLTPTFRSRVTYLSGENV